MEYKTVANPDGTISIVPVNQAQGIMVPAYETNQLDLVNQINKSQKNIGVPMTLEETMAGSVLPPNFNAREFKSIFPTTGIMQQASIPFGSDIDIQQGFTRNTPSDQGTNFQFLSSANEADETDEVEETKTGIAKLFDFISNFIPGVGLLKRFSDSGGIKGLNQRLQQSDFGQSDSFAEFLKRRRDREALARDPNVFKDARNITSNLRRTADDDVIDRGRGNRPGGSNYSAPSKPQRSFSSDYSEAQRARKF